MAIVHAVGTPENDSERIAVSYLAEHLPPHYVLFHNLELPTSSGLPYEYDIIVIGDFAIYMVEVKGYKGRIRGNAHDWEFESGAIHRSPVPLTNKKAKILADRIRRGNRSLQSAWVQPIVVLTDQRVQIQLDDPQASRVMRLEDSISYMIDRSQLPVQAQSIERLVQRLTDALYSQFKPLHRQHQINDYHILETIGNNDLYSTVLAEHAFISTRSRFVLKIYSIDVYASPEDRAEWQRRVMRDADVLLRLAGHPNIVTAYPPFSWEDNKIVLPREWVDGYTLKGLLEAGEHMTLEHKLDIIRQVATGLKHAHEHGVIHRNLRPDKLIISTDGSVKLVNFDCARVEGNNLQTISGQIGGQLDQRYVAPEIWSGPVTATPAADLYALGIVLFEILTGAPPYQTLREVVQHGGLPYLPTSVDPTLPAALDTIIGHLCAFAPENRYSSADQVLADLELPGLRVG